MIRPEQYTVQTHRADDGTPGVMVQFDRYTKRWRFFLETEGAEALVAHLYRATAEARKMDAKPEGEV